MLGTLFAGVGTRELSVEIRDILMMKRLVLSSFDGSVFDRFHDGCGGVLVKVVFCSVYKVLYELRHTIVPITYFINFVKINNI